MNLLAFDTSTETMSIAVQRSGVAKPWLHDGAGGAQASAQLIPSIESLMRQAQLALTQLDAIVFGAGPGSFTGLRSACAVAQGLAFGANVPVLPVNTLLAVAEAARLHYPEAQEVCVTALLDARMDELYMARFAYAQGGWRALEAACLIKPEQCLPNPSASHGLHLLAGNVFDNYGARLADQGSPRIAALPMAAALLRLAPRLLAGGGAVCASAALPLYVRDKVAQTTQERMAIQSAKGAP